MATQELVKTVDGLYQAKKPVKESVILDAAKEIMAEKLRTEGSLIFTSQTLAANYLYAELALEERECFAVLFLDSQNRMIAMERLFYGTISQSPVFPREIAKRCLLLNAAAIIVSHNHPSRMSEPSAADQNITEVIADVVRLIDVRLLDHLIIGEMVYSFAEHGLL